MNQTIASTLLAARSGRSHANPALAVAVRGGQCAQLIAEGFLASDAGLRALVRRAADRFESCDWQGSQFDADEADALRRHVLESTVRELHQQFGPELQHTAFWTEVRRHYLSLIDDLPDSTWSRMYFNRVTATVFGAAADSARLRIDSVVEREGAAARPPLRTVQLGGDLTASVRTLLETLPVEAAWCDVADCSARLAQQLRSTWPDADPMTVTLLDAGFYRFTRAHVFGHVESQGRRLPLALILRNSDQGMALDQVLLDAADIGALFGAPRTGFQVELEYVAGSLLFLQSLLPAAQRPALLEGMGRAT
jgi:isocitrate dehydrogenase kinase/phosphatase